MNRPSLRLEQVHAGERAAAVDDKDALSALARDDEAVLQRLPPKTMARQIEAALASAPSSSSSSSSLPRWSLVAAPSFALAAGLALFVVVNRPGIDVDGARDGVGHAGIASGDVLKGSEPALLIGRAAGAAVEPLSSWANVKPGDVLQLRIRAAGAAYGVVVSVDGAGHVTRHQPEHGSDTALPAGTTSLPSSFELDDAPRFERFFLVTSKTPLDVDAIEAAAAATARSKDPRIALLSGLPQGAHQTDVVLVKPIE